MDIRQIRYFLTVAQEGQFTKAAKRLNIAQPPLSQQIKQLEEELGMTLLKRGGKHIELTDAGQVLVVRAEQILELVNSTKSELDDLSKGTQGRVSIGSVSSSGAFLLPKRFKDFHERHPQVTFQLWEGDTYRIMDLVDKGIVDIGIVRTPFSLEIYNYIFQSSANSSDPMIAIFKEKWKPDASDGPIALESFKNMPLIIHRHYERSIVDSFRKIGVEPNILCKSGDIHSILDWANIGLGVGLIPKPPVDFLRFANMQYRDIMDRSLATKIAVIWLKGTYLSAATKSFIKAIVDESERDKLSRLFK